MFPFRTFDSRDCYSSHCWAPSDTSQLSVESLIAPRGNFLPSRYCVHTAAGSYCVWTLAWNDSPFNSAFTPSSNVLRWEQKQTTKIFVRRTSARQVGSRNTFYTPVLHFLTNITHDHRYSCKELLIRNASNASQSNHKSTIIEMMGNDNLD